VPARFAKLYFQFFHRGAEIDVVLGRMTPQILQTPFQLKDRFFEIKRLPFHEVKPLKC
jgi:hypothetical protein